MKRERLILFFIFMGIFAGVYQAGSMSNVSQEESELFMKDFEELVFDIDAYGIFIHNLTIALPMFIPGFGMIWGLFSAWSTGFAFAAIAVSNPIVENIPPLSILFLSPFGLMEIIAYSIGISRSFLIIKSVIKKTGLKEQFRPTIIEAVIVIILLLVGGYLEYYMIEIAQEQSKSLL
jgi:hypothetical protein